MLQEIINKNAEKGLIFDRPLIPFVISDIKIDEDKKHGITLHIDPQKAGNTFRKKVHVFKEEL